jgi:YbbR domain-containing protein
MRIFHNFGMKVVSLGLAALLWLSVSAQRLEQVSVRSFDVPISFVEIPRDLIITRANRDTVNVRLRGRVSRLRELSSENLEATLDLSGSGGGEVGITITPQALNVPQGVEVLSIEPSRVTFELDPRRQKSVPIRPFFVGELPPGYGYDQSEVTINPSNALVSGPASLMNDVTEVATERIILSGRTEPFRQRVAVVSDSPLVRVVDPANAVVNVLIRTQTGPQPSPETELENSRRPSAP